MMATASNTTPLSDLSLPQIDLVLEKLQLYAPQEYDADERLGLLLCSKIYRRHFSGYEFDSVLAKFIKGQFIDFESSDETISGIFPKKSGKNVVLYPCLICAHEVTDEHDSTGFGLHCSGCENFFHNSCNDHPITTELYNQLKSSPSYVKTYCSNCNVAMQDVSQRLRRMDRKVKEIKTGVESMKEDLTTKASLYSAKLQQNGTSTESAKLTNNLSRQFAAQQKALKVEETEERNKRTILIRKPMDLKITNSKALRSSFNKEFPGVVIKTCRVTAGGSFKVELDKEEEVKEVTSQWKTESFGGNMGVASPSEMQTSGIIKHIYLEHTEEELIAELQSKYSSITKVELFKKNGTFTGTVKVIFKTSQDLQDAMTDRIKIFNQRYIMEDYRPLPRVIKCNRCQNFGHIARRCRAEKPKCGKCGEQSHESLNCTSSVRKCSHCNENHETGDKSCKIMKEKMDEIKQRAQYGF